MGKWDGEICVVYIALLFVTLQETMGMMVVMEAT